MKKIEKGLIYTKTFYEQIADEAKNILESMQYEEEKTKVTQYGIFYNAIAGLLRSGVLCSRVTGEDGFPELRIVLGNKAYQCRENIIRTILGDEADYIISPFEDTFESYVGLSFNDIPKAIPEEPDDAPDNDKQAPVNIKKIKKAHEAELKKLKASYEDQIKELTNAMKKQSDVPNVSAPAPEVIEKIVTVDDPEPQKRIKELESVNVKLQRQAELASQKELEITNLKKQLRDKDELINEHDKYTYEPDYDPYYNEELPGLIASLKFMHTDLTAKIALIITCVGGLALCALMIL